MSVIPIDKWLLLRSAYSKLLSPMRAMVSKLKLTVNEAKDADLPAAGRKVRLSGIHVSGGATRRSGAGLCLEAEVAKLFLMQVVEHQQRPIDREVFVRGQVLRPRLIPHKRWTERETGIVEFCESLGPKSRRYSWARPEGELTVGLLIRLL